MSRNTPQRKENYARNNREDYRETIQNGEETNRMKDRYYIKFDEVSMLWVAENVFANEQIALEEFYQEEMTTIGNTIDNPELLEVQE